MERELIALRVKIESSRRVVASKPEPGKDPIVHRMIVREIKKRLPGMERRAAWMEAGEERRGVREG